MVFRAINQSRGRILADRVEEATGFSSRLIGLMGRPAPDFSIGAGFHLVPCRSIHTFFMRFPLDALFLDPSGVVIKAYMALPPWRVTGLFPATRSVLELPAGVVAGSGTLPGDQVIFDPIPADDL